MLATPPPVPQVGPVVFSLLFGGQLHTVDLSDLPCPRLTRRLAQALAGLGGDDNTMRYLDGFRQTVAQVRRFVCFVAEVQSADADADDFDVPHLAPDLLAAYEQRLLARHGTTSTEPHRGMAKLVRLLRKVYDNDPGSFEPALQARIGYASTSAETTIGTPLDAYPSRVFEEIAAQAAEDVRKILNRIQDGEHGAALGTDPRTARGGWGKLNNALWYVDHHGPLTGREQKIWGVQCLGGIRAVNAHLFLTSADLVPLHALLICQTGLEPESVKQLRANCLVNPARGFVSISYVKNRSHGQSHKTLRVADGGALHHPGGLIRLALRLTQRGRALTGSEALWVQVTATGHPEDAFDRRRDLSTRTRDWVAASPRLSGLKDQDGRPLRVDLRRLRKTFKSVRYQQAAGILSDFTAGHTQGVAARHYADIAAHRDVHEQAVEAGLEEAMNAALPPPAVLDEDANDLTRERQRSRRPTSPPPWPNTTTSSWPPAETSSPPPSRKPKVPPARCPSGGAWNARTRCTPPATSPACCCSWTSSKPSGNSSPPPSGKAATGWRGSGSSPGYAPNSAPARSRWPGPSPRGPAPGWRCRHSSWPVSHDRARTTPKRCTADRRRCLRRSRPTQCRSSPRTSGHR